MLATQDAVARGEQAQHRLPYLGSLRGGLLRPLVRLPPGQLLSATAAARWGAAGVWLLWGGRTGAYAAGEPAARCAEVAWLPLSRLPGMVIDGVALPADLRWSGARDGQYLAIPSTANRFCVSIDDEFSTMMNLNSGHWMPGRWRRPWRSCAQGVLTVALALLPIGLTWAQGFGATDYPFYAAPQLSFAASNFMNLSVLNQTQPGAAAEALTASVSTVAPESPVPLRTAETLARAYAPKQPGPLKSVLEQSLDLFAKAALKAQQPANDVAVALAFFVAANYSASQGQPLVADADFPRLVAQMRNGLAASPAFQKTNARLKRETFEQLAMVGMFVYLAKLELDKSPASEPAKHFRNHARANLASVLGMPADRVVLSQGTLALR